MQVFPITTFPWRSFVAVSVITIALPLTVIALALAFSGVLPGWLVILATATAIGLLLSVNAALTALALYVATRNEVTIRDGTMHLKGGEFHERVPLEAVVQAAVIDLRTRPDLAGARRRNGITLPGFRVGWFETDDARWLFVLRAAQRRLLYVETDINFSVLLGVQAPEQLAARLLRNSDEDRNQGPTGPTGLD